MIHEVREPGVGRHSADVVELRQLAVLGVDAAVRDVCEGVVTAEEQSATERQRSDRNRLNHP